MGVITLDDPIARWLPELTAPSVVRLSESPLDDLVAAGICCWVSRPGASDARLLALCLSDVTPAKVLSQIARGLSRRRADLNPVRVSVRAYRPDTDHTALLSERSIQRQPAFR